MAGGCCRGRGIQFRGTKTKGEREWEAARLELGEKRRTDRQRAGRPLTYTFRARSEMQGT